MQLLYCRTYRTVLGATKPWIRGQPDSASQLVSLGSRTLNDLLHTVVLLPTLQIGRNSVHGFEINNHKRARLGPQGPRNVLPVGRN